MGRSYPFLSDTLKSPAQVCSRGLDIQENGVLTDDHCSSQQDTFSFVSEITIVPLGIMAVMSRNLQEHVVI